MSKPKNEEMVTIYIDLQNDQFVKAQELGINIEEICRKAIRERILTLQSVW